MILYKFYVILYVEIFFLKVGVTFIKMNVYTATTFFQ